MFKLERSTILCVLIATLALALAGCGGGDKNPVQPVDPVVPPVTDPDDPVVDPAGGSDDLAFEVGAPHLKGVVAEADLPDDVKKTVTDILDRKPVEEDRMARVRTLVSPALSAVLDGVAGGASVEDAVADAGSAADVVRAVDPDTADRWEEFSKQAEQVEKNVETFITAFNQRDAEALVKTISLPFYVDDMRIATAEQFKIGAAQEWGEGSDRDMTVHVVSYTHMPTEAFDNATNLGEFPINDKVRAYVKLVLEGKPGYVTLCMAEIEKDGVRKDPDANLLVSRKDGEMYLIAGVAE